MMKDATFWETDMSYNIQPQHPDIAEAMWIKINEIITANRMKPGSVITVLRECQNIVGYLPVELIDHISRGLNLSPSDVFGVVSFYSLFFTGAQRQAYSQGLYGNRLLCQRDKRGHRTNL